MHSSLPPKRVLLVGYGLAGAVFHAPLIAATDGLVIAGIVTSQHQEQARQAFPLATIFATFDDAMLVHDTFDVAVIATPNRWHYPQALAALQARLSVVVDKPLAPTAREAEHLIAVSQQLGVDLTCFQNRRWDGDFQTIQHIVNTNLIGQITRFESHFDRWRPAPKANAWRESRDPLDAGGLLFDLGAHLIDQAVLLFGRPATVYAEQRTLRPGAQVDDDTFVALTYAQSYLSVHLYMSALARISTPRFALQGLRGGYIKYGLDPQEADLQAGKRPGNPGWGQDPQARWGHLLTDVSDATIDGQLQTFTGDYESFYRDLYQALTNGGSIPVDPADSAYVLHLIEAAQQSQDTHQVIRV